MTLVQRADGLFQEEDKQAGMIYGIAGKRGFKWSRKAIFNYCVKSCPELGEILERRDWGKGYALSKLLRFMSVDQKSHVIKRLLMIEKNNTARIELLQLK